MPESLATQAAYSAGYGGCSRPSIFGFKTSQLGDTIIETGYCTHIGGRKAANEDSIFLTPSQISPVKINTRGLLWSVADGIGGHNGGKIASELACRALNAYYNRPLAEKGEADARMLGRHLTETVIRIDRLVRLRGASNEQLAHMGTTLSCLLIAGRHTVIAHVGDSRIYRWRRGRLTCLTTDHTFVQEMIFEGEVNAENAQSHPLRNLLTHVVGTAEPLSYVQDRIDPLQTSDRFLLCTDGLHHVVGDHNLAAIMASETDAGQAARKLVDAALKRRTQDNVTALVVALRGDHGSHGNQSN